MAKRRAKTKQVETLTHEEARRRNIPTAELQSINERLEEITPPRPVRYKRARPLPKGETRERDEDLDPQIVWNGLRISLTKEQRDKLVEDGTIEIGDAQLVWRGKDRQDWTDLVVNVPPIYVQEKIHPKALIDDLIRRSKKAGDEDAPDLFANFNGIDPETRCEFYEHDQYWSNRMILGDSLQVMASLAEREKLRGKLQAIYFDPPYGIRFNSNWQVSTRSRDVKDGKLESLTREPEQVKAFRDTWKDGIHSYLTYLRDRLTVMRDLLTESGSIFVQIGDENVHRVRAVMDEVFGEENFVSEIAFKKTAGLGKGEMPQVVDFILWFAKDLPSIKKKTLFYDKEPEEDAAYSLVKETVGHYRRIPKEEQGDADLARFQILLAAGRTPSCVYPIDAFGETFAPTAGRSWSTNPTGMTRLFRADRVAKSGRTLSYVRFVRDNPVNPHSNFWSDTASGSGMNKLYVVQTNEKIIQRCLLMTTDPGDLVLDPTCGSGTTATVAEQWGRRWITIDTSRVALALARQRLMSARYPYYYLKDSADGRMKDAEIAGKPPKDGPTHGDVRQGFVYERAPHITLKSIANNAEIDLLWEQYQEKLEPLREALNKELGTNWEEWEIPRDLDAGDGSNKGDAPPSPVYGRGAGGEGTNPSASAASKVKSTLTPNPSPASGRGEPVSAKARKLHAKWWENRIARQKEIDASIAKAADVEYLYDRPYVDNSRVRVAGPFTVESLSPHRVVPMDDEELLDDPSRPASRAPQDEAKRKRRKSALSNEVDFVQVILETCAPPACSRARRKTASPSPTSRPGRAISFAPRACFSKAKPSAAPPS